MKKSKVDHYQQELDEWKDHLENAAGDTIKAFVEDLQEKLDDLKGAGKEMKKYSGKVPAGYNQFLNNISKLLNDAEKKLKAQQTPLDKSINKEINRYDEFIKGCENHFAKQKPLKSASINKMEKACQKMQVRLLKISMLDSKNPKIKPMEARVENVIKKIGKAKEARIERKEAIKSQRKEDKENWNRSRYTAGRFGRGL